MQQRCCTTKADSILCDCDEKICQVIEFSCPAISTCWGKLKRNGPLMRNLQIMYKEYCFKMVQFIVLKKAVLQ